MKSLLLRASFGLLMAFQLACVYGFADDGVYIHQEGNVVYVFPWRFCLIASIVLSVGFYLARGSSKS